jgi:hypothetical protein
MKFAIATATANTAPTTSDGERNRFTNRSFFHPRPQIEWQAPNRSSPAPKPDP